MEWCPHYVWDMEHHEDRERHCDLHYLDPPPPQCHLVISDERQITLSSCEAATALLPVSDSLGPLLSHGSPH